MRPVAWRCILASRGLGEDMGRFALVAMTVGLLALVAGCGSSAKKRPPSISRTVLTQVARNAQEEMRTKLGDRKVVVRGMQCKPATNVAYACGLQVVDGSRHAGIVIIYLRFNPTTNSGVMAFTDATNRHWKQVLTARRRRA
jgi:predicted component of type VI protein secretion system